MSIPKSVNRTVKRRGLAIATAVAIAGSGVVSGNYAFAKELGDDSRAMTPGLVTGPGGNQTDSAINGPTENVDETSAEKENLNQSVTAVEYFNQHESGIVASLRPADISEAPGAEAVANHFLTQAKKMELLSIPCGSLISTDWLRLANELFYRNTIRPRRRIISTTMLVTLPLPCVHQIIHKPWAQML